MGIRRYFHVSLNNKRTQQTFSIGILLLMLLLYTVAFRYAPANSPASVPALIKSVAPASATHAVPAFKWTGAWHPTRKSAGDGITQLDTKIGRFITLTGPSVLAHVIFNVQRKFPGSTPWVTWAVGDLGNATPAYSTMSVEAHEAWLTRMDQLHVTVFLEIFPFKANAKKGITATDVPAAINEWLTRFKHHPSIKGMGIELEYFGKASDSLAQQWDALIKSHNPGYRMFLRHYNPDYMPPTYRGKGDLIFINDASEGTLEELNKGFADWANRFAPTACAFQLGYPADEDGMNGSNELGWWKLKDPIRDWGQAILPLVRDPQQELGFIWVTAQSGKSYHTKWDLTKGVRLPRTTKN